RVGSDRHLELLKDALEPLQLPVLGVLRRQDNIAIPNRHLGLVPTAEMSQMESLIDQLAYLGESCFDWGRLLPLLSTSPSELAPKSPLKRETLTQFSPLKKGGWGGSPGLTTNSNLLLVKEKTQLPIRLAIARDRAFSFYYQDNLDTLQQLGAELVPWSPLTDATLPENIQGLYFGGGFPEVFAQQLEENSSAREAVRRAILQGMPTYAECGGLMYLCEKIADFEGQSWAMVGVLPTTTLMGKRLTVGYRQATVLQDSPLLPAGATVWGHEFHHSQLTVLPEKPLFETRGYDGGKVATEGWQLHQLHASYVHLHWGGHPEIPAQFLQQCYMISG
ncbi:MAG TPA: cobyrinate a,c-diamide synthase, partial [Cyanophyceae cyanobacterium]